ncbi:MAG: class I SAM-dependent methyltransferase [Myxococcales bacterium FL481]|nr:MAG: class I SAM-dependent methyltransferase [Myxococcales bacterium FL481]
MLASLDGAHRRACKVRAHSETAHGTYNRPLRTPPRGSPWAPASSAELHSVVSSLFNSSYVGLRPEIWQRVPPQAKTILDVGSSDGTLGAFLLQQRPDRRVFGVECDAQMANVAASRLTGVTQADVESLDWSDVGDAGEFDCIIFADVLEHLRDPWTTLARATDRLSDDGVLIVSLPNVRHISAAWSIYVDGGFPRRSRGIFDATHLRWFTPRDARRLCEDAGLAPQRLDFTFRLFDRAGGFVNRIVSSQCWLRFVPLIRDLLGYQMVLSARKKQIKI